MNKAKHIELQVRSRDLARNLLNRKALILDTETTGLDSEAEICEITVIEAPSGRVLINQRVKPNCLISPSATMVHGITDADVATAPSISDAIAELRDLLIHGEQPLAIYSATFDLRLLDQSLGTGRLFQDHPNALCVKEMYAEYHGEWNDFHKSFAWQKLDDASKQCGLEWEGEAHTALADCLMTLKLMKYLATAQIPGEVADIKKANQHPTNPNLRVYDPLESAVFQRNRDRHGILSNMYPVKIVVNGSEFNSSEALYQACRFPNNPDIQTAIMREKNAMAAKISAHKSVQLSRSDWMQARVRVMRWVLRTKLAQNPKTFGADLLSTEDMPIVEHSTRDAFWGADLKGGKFVGTNALGRLLMELRGEYSDAVKNGKMEPVSPPALSDFNLLGVPVGEVHWS